MRTLKKSLLLLFVTLTLAVIFCLGASAKTVPASGSCGENVTYTYNSTTKELVISGSGAMTNYSYDGSPFYDSDIKSVVIKEGVTTIGERAFYSCDGLQSVTIPDSVTTIGSEAFRSCESLQSVTIGNSVTTIGSEAFRSCENLQSVTIGNSVTSIGSYAFYGCTGLQSVTIPDSVTTIGDYAFKSCYGLQSITIPDSVTTIGSAAFASCYSITVDKDNKYYCNDEYGVLFDKNKTKLIQYPVGNKRTSYTIPDSVTTIGSAAFASCYRLESITIPDSVTTIGDDAFCNCDSLQSVTIPDSVTTIGDDAFYNCGSLQSVTIPNSVTTIGSSAFYYCDSLESVTIGGSVTTIGERAFYYCDSLESVTIGGSVTTIGECAFYSCCSLESITIPDSVTTIGERAFSSCYSLESITIPDSVTTIGNSAFYECYNLQSVTIPDSVTTIGSAAFAWCDSLHNIIIGYRVITIGVGAFDGCTKLKNVYYKGIKEQWEKITIYYGNDYLTEATICYHYNNNHTEIGMKAVDSTCTEIGYTAGKYCPDCETWLEGHTEIPTIPHAYKPVLTKATLTANGKTEYKCSCGDIEKTETITKVSSLTLSTTKYIYDGKNKTPKLTVKDSNGKTLVKNTDYKITVASKRAGIGRYTVKVTLIGNYSGSKNLYFYILPGKSASVKSASQTVSSVKLSWSAVPGAAGYTIYRYSSSKKAYVKEGTTEGTTFTVKSLYAGKKYTFRVVAYGKTAAGKVYNSETYALLKTATKTKTPVISDVAVYKGKVKLFWTPTSGETGYTVYYSTSKTSGFKKYKNYESNSGYVNNLTSGKTYYFKVRTYIKTDSGYVYSPWSNIKGVKVK